MLRPSAESGVQDLDSRKPTKARAAIEIDVVDNDASEVARRDGARPIFRGAGQR
jgi:hypothetical protein